MTYSIVGIVIKVIWEVDDIFLLLVRPATRVLKKKKLRINVHRPVGTRVIFDEEGNTLLPLARITDIKNSSDKVLIDQDKREEFYRKWREELKQADKEDKLHNCRRRQREEKEGEDEEKEV